MKEFRFVTAMDLPLKPEMVFEFFAEAENLERITPPQLNFSITSPRPVQMATGTRITYRLRLHGMPFTWKTAITQWDPPAGFVDEQLKGPYARWIHTHRFETLPTGGTRIHDDVRYVLPFGFLGRLALPLVRRELRRIFEYRRRAVSQLASKKRTGLKL